jgi:acyl-coenzyme A thioesterase PaaI-like protein
MPLTDEQDLRDAAGAMTEFFSARVPGQLGCVFDHAATDLVIGHIDVTDNLIAGTGFLFAPAVVALADTCAAIGCGRNIPPESSFTTMELKSNFLSSARTGERVVCRCEPAPGSSDTCLGCRGHERVHGAEDGVVPLHADGPDHVAVARHTGVKRAADVVIATGQETLARSGERPAALNAAA